MKAVFLARYGRPGKSFEIRDCPAPDPGENDVLIRVEAFGLNFADVMARNGLYRAAPPPPSVLGYEVAGRVENTGSNVKELQAGQRVVAFTRFGGYAEYVSTPHQAVIPLPEEITSEQATALPTQYCTAYHCAYDIANVREGEHVLIHAAAGGVGVALTQLVKRRGCIVYGTVGSDEKLSTLTAQGVDYPFNYRKTDYRESVREVSGERKMDVIFNSVGGKTFRKDRKLLAVGGRLVGYGAADRLSRRNTYLSTYRFLFAFGFIHPASLLRSSSVVGGVNMLRIADHKPEILRRCLIEVTALAARGEITPLIGGVFPAGEIARAHELLESRNSVGKIVMKW